MPLNKKRFVQPVTSRLPSAQGLGIYVHFPWCLKKCPYCDFLSIAVRSPGSSASLSAQQARGVLPHKRYADALLAELSSRVSRLAKPWPRLQSIFFGGGTPSLFEPTEIARVIDGIAQLFPDDFQSNEVEITAECNPTSFSVLQGQKLHKAGVNRVSIGVQSLDSNRLEFLGRLHDGPQGLRAVHEALESGLPRVSADLIFGVHAQSKDAAVEDVRQVAQTGVSHISAYALTIEEGTRFGALHAKGKLPLLKDAQVAASFEAVSQELQTFGFEHYEISNFARAGHQSVHNLGYWLGRDYLGLGTGAFGTLSLREKRLRYKNVVSPERYMDTWTPGAKAAQRESSFDPFVDAISESEEITASIAHQEALMLGLRTSYGVDLGQLAELRGEDPLSPQRDDVIDKLIDQEKLQRTGTRLVLPRAQWLFADGIIRDLL